MDSDHRPDTTQDLAVFKHEVANEDAYATIEITSIHPDPNPQRQAQQRRYVRLVLAIITACVILASTLMVMVNYLANRSTIINVGSPFWTFNGTGMFTTPLHWSADGQQLSFPAQGLTKTEIYNLSTRKLMQYPDISAAIPPQNDHSQAIELTPDGKYVTIIEYNSITHWKYQLLIWDTVTGKVLFRNTYHGKPTTKAASTSTQEWWSTDGTQMATLDNDGSLIIWQTMSGKAPFRLSDTYRPFDYVAWSANDKELAASTESGHVEIWNLSKRTRLSVGLISPSISSLTFAPNTHYLAAIDNDSLYVLSTNSGTISVDNALSLPIINGDPVLWSADSQYMVVTGKNADDTTINGSYSTAVWEAAASRQIMITPILGSANGMVTIIEQNHTMVIQTQPPQDETVSISPNKRYLATLEDNGNTVDVWEINTGRKISTHQGKINRTHPLLAWSPDGKYLAATFENNEMRIWNAQTGSDMMVFDQSSGIKNSASASIQALQWSPDTACIAIVNAYIGTDRQPRYTVAIWNTPLN